MSRINTMEASKHWGEEKEFEVGYLKAIQFVALEISEDDQVYISLPTDEEGNSDIVLTAKAAKFVAKELLTLALTLEKHPNQLLVELKEEKRKQEVEMQKEIDAYKEARQK